MATNTSTPRDSIRFCLWGDIPPTIAATLTGGGGFGILGFFEVDRSSAARMPFKQAFKCDDIWRASSRVGARINARTGLRVFDSGFFLPERSLCRMGNPYANVFPDPCAIVNACGQRKKATANRFCHTHDIPSLQGKRKGLQLNRRRIREGLIAQGMYELIMESKSVPLRQQPTCRTVSGNDFLHVLTRYIGNFRYVGSLAILW